MNWGQSDYHLETLWNDNLRTLLVKLRSRRLTLIQCFVLRRLTMSKFLLAQIGRDPIFCLRQIGVGANFAPAPGVRRRPVKDSGLLPLVMISLVNDYWPEPPSTRTLCMS